MFESKNVLGDDLIPCSMSPKTGFFRDGCCNTDHTDQGMHTVCIKVDEDFLKYSKIKGNDLSTDIPEFGFVGLKEGDSWCLCAPRWLEAFNEGWAPKVRLESTHEETLAVIPLDTLKEFSIS
jgi:uncharacterized protein (DUF2237 family)